MSEARNDDPRRDGEISAAYRTRSAESPPAGLDARILAAAHRAAGGRPGGRKHRWSRWIDAPFATAAVVLVSATLIVLMREEDMLGQRAAKEAKRASATQERAVQAPVPAAPPAVIENGAADMSRPAAPAEVRARAEEETGASAPQREPPAAANASSSPKGGTAVPAPPEPQRHDALAPATAPITGERAQAPGGVSVEGSGPMPPLEKREAAPEPFPAEAPAAAATIRQQAAPPAATPGRAAVMPSAPDASLRAAPAGAPPRAAAPRSAEVQAPAADVEEAGTAGKLAREKTAGPAVQTPEERWLAEIRELVRAGKFTDAQLSLARFVRAYPDYRVPADIIDALKPAD